MIEMPRKEEIRKMIEYEFEIRGNDGTISEPITNRYIDPEKDENRFAEEERVQFLLCVIECYEEMQKKSHELESKMMETIETLRNKLS